MYEGAKTRVMYEGAKTIVMCEGAKTRVRVYSELSQGLEVKVEIRQRICVCVNFSFYRWGRCCHRLGKKSVSSEESHAGNFVHTIEVLKNMCET